MIIKKIRCKKCKKNDWAAETETDDDTTMLFLICKCGHAWTAILDD